MFEISPNFSFLKVTDLAELGTLAEKYYQSDPNTSLIKCRQFAELCAKYISAKIGIYEEIKKETLIFIINKLHYKKAIEKNIYDLFNDIRNLANSEVHLDPKHLTNINPDENNKVNSDIALDCIKKIHKIADWFHKTYYVNPKIPYKPKEYLIPHDDLMKQSEIKLNELNEQEEQKINAHIQSSDVDKELIKISQESMINIDKITEKKAVNKLHSGQIIGHRYQIIDELSSGNFGTTYIALDLNQFSERCIVKQFTPRQSNDGTFNKARTLFYQEAEMLKKLGKHSEIPQLFAYFEEDNNLFLVQEYIEGNTLRDELDGRWEEKAVTELLKDILTPLAFIHEKEIVHRDIKPENLIRRISDNKIVVIDFGAVKQKLIENTKDEATIIGTKGYMSPEQLMGKISYACDIYAVGVIAIEALTGRKIPEGLSSAQCLEEVTFISDELKQILIKMTAFSPDDRYASVKEVLEATDTMEKTINKPSIDIPEKIEDPIKPPQDSPSIWFIVLAVTFVSLAIGFFVPKNHNVQYSSQSKQVIPNSPKKNSAVELKIETYEVNDDDITIKARDNYNNLYYVETNHTILNQIPNSPPPQGLKNKNIEILYLSPIISGQNKVYQVDYPNQLIFK